MAREGSPPAGIGNESLIAQVVDRCSPLGYTNMDQGTTVLGGIESGMDEVDHDARTSRNLHDVAWTDSDPGVLEANNAMKMYRVVARSHKMPSASWPCGSSRIEPFLINK